MSLIFSSNKVTIGEIEKVFTPTATENHFPIPHAELIKQVRKSLEDHGFQILEEEHALARKGLRYFGGFAVTSPEVAGDRRRLVVGLRNAHDKSFAAAIVLGNKMMVCENLCFSSEVKLGRKHTKFIMRDLPTVVSKAISQLTKSWLTMEERIKAYESTNVDAATAYEYLVHLVDVKALTSQKLYRATELFRNPALAALEMVVPAEVTEGMSEEDVQETYQSELADKQSKLSAEFGKNTLWTLYNAFTECLKGGDLSKLPQRTMMAQSFFDAKANFSPVVQEDLEEVSATPEEQTAAMEESFGSGEIDPSGEAEAFAVEAGQE